MDKLLRRQLRRFFGAPEKAPPELQPFLAAVDAAYRSSDAERARLERSLASTAQELSARNDELRRDLADRELAPRSLLERTSLTALEAEVERALTRGSHVDGSTYHTCIEAIASYVQALAAGIWGLDEERQVLTPLARAGSCACVAADPSPVPVGEGLVGEVAAARLPRFVGATAGDPGDDPGVSIGMPECQAGAVAFAGFPLMVGERLLGAMTVYFRRLPSEAIRATLASLANTIALGIDARQVHAALRESEERFRTFMDNTPAVAFLKDEQGRVLWVNRPYERVFGTRLEEIRGRTDAERWPPELAAHLGEVNAAVLAGGEPVQIIQDLPTPDGTRTWLALKFPFRDASGRRFLGCVSIDVTAARGAEAALRDSEARYRLLFESNPQPMWVFDSETLAFLAVNSAAESHYGFSRDEFLRMTLADLLAPEDRPDLFAGLAETRRIATHQRRVHHCRRDGSTIVVDILSHRIQLAGREARLVLVTDVTERQRLEEHLRQRQKMEAVGLLAGGIAHDFNNLLTVISGYAALAIRDLPAESRASSQLAEVLRAADRAASLTQQLLAFSRQQRMQPRVLDLNELLREMQGLLRRLIREDIELVLALDPGLGRVLADPTQIEQVVMNLVVNARDAMPHGGRLLLATAGTRLEGGEGGADFSVTTGDYVRLTVSDTGIGMDATTRSRAFEPFFTTKEKGRGTGLGLSTVYGVVKQSGGYVWLESQPGQGCSVHVHLPRIDPQPLPVAAPAEVLATPARGAGETVVVAEDEAALRALVVGVLTAGGYRVLAAASGREALDLCRRLEGEIDLLLTDVVMPEMNGPELARQVAEIHPEASVLYMSGYTDKAIAGPALDQAPALLEKPFLPADLVRRVREVLAGGRRGGRPMRRREPPTGGSGSTPQTL